MNEIITEKKFVHVVTDTDLNRIEAYTPKYRISEQNFSVINYSQGVKNKAVRQY